MEKNNKEMKKYLMVAGFESRGFVGVDDFESVEFEGDIDAGFVWDYMVKSVGRSDLERYEEYLKDWTGVEVRREDFANFLEEGKLCVGSSVMYGVSEEGFLVFFENVECEDRDEILKMVEEFLGRL